jgi:hypothetical protein
LLNGSSSPVQVILYLFQRFQWYEFHYLVEHLVFQGEETVSRELTNITSILRSGKNTITLTAKNQDGTKVGFVTAVYVKRGMTAVSL